MGTNSCFCSSLSSICSQENFSFSFIQTKNASHFFLTNAFYIKLQALTSLMYWRTPFLYPIGENSQFIIWLPQKRTEMTFLLIITRFFIEYNKSISGSIAVCIYLRNTIGSTWLTISYAHNHTFPNNFDSTKLVYIWYYFELNKPHSKGFSL